MSVQAFERTLMLCRFTALALVFLTVESAAAALAPNLTDVATRDGDGRFEIEVRATAVSVHASAATRSPVIGALQQGARVISDRQLGTWYRIVSSGNQSGWINLVTGRNGPNFSVLAGEGVARSLPGANVTSTAPLTPGEGAVAASVDAPSADSVEQRRPMGKPLEPIAPIIDDRQVPPPSPLLPNETLPVPDRWRLADQLGLVNQRWYDPYNANTIKGDRPVFGDDGFVILSAVSDTLYEARRLPTSIGAQSSDRPQSDDQFGRGRQSAFTENLILQLSILKGDTAFKPPEFEIRIVPVLNYNYSETQEVRVLNIDPTKGTTRRDGFVALQEAFVDYEYRIVSDRYDFDDVRVGIQPFISDFRGFLFQDQPLGVRFFGTRDNNRWQYNLAWFRRIDKDTNSGLNDIGKPLRRDDVFFANLYRQDFPIPGFTLQGTVVYNDNSEDSTAFLDNNGFQVRPAVQGDARPHKYRVTYLGVNGDGHFGRWNTTASAYWALGHDDHSQLAQQAANINAFFAAAEVSRDFDWARVRASALFASGDKNPFDNRETGFDAILENPQFAGADTSFWIRQAVPLIGGGGVALSGRNAVLPDLRSSKDQGQSNFTNPGLVLIGAGVDLDLTPQVRAIANVNQLWFADTSSLSVLRNQGSIDRSIGTDISVALQYRPLFIQNIVLNFSAAALVPGKGFQQLYASSGSATPYSILVNLLVTF